MYALCCRDMFFGHLKGSSFFKRSLRFSHLQSVPQLYLTNVDLDSRSIVKTPTNFLLSKLGFVQHPKAGLVNWLPMGLLTLNNASTIIHKRMKEAGAEEMSLSLLSSSDLWEESGRWNNSELFKLQDSTGNKFCLAATCEEEITKLVHANMNSYKNMPLLYYQIKEKFRDEKRPRSGLLRGREFVMKDAYSFDVDEEKALESYEKVVRAYSKILEDLKIPFVKAEADTGDMGGSLSHEWHYRSRIGEDTLFTCDNCNHSSNAEKTQSFPHDLDSSIPVSVRYFTTENNTTLICAYYPSGRHLEHNFIREHIPDIIIDGPDEKLILEEFSNIDTLISKRVVRIMDSRLTLRSNFPDFPIPFVNRSLITTLIDIPLVRAEEGELCAICEEGSLKSGTSIEVGHTFYLGDKYTRSLDCKVEVPDHQGKPQQKNILMGCYGIGVSRLVAAVAEINRDNLGLRWPSSMAPWQATIVESPSFNPKERDIFVNAITGTGVTYRLDDRDKVGFGKKIAQSQMVGIPLAVILGKSFPVVEIEIRGKRHNNDQSWMSLYEKKDFYWQVERDPTGQDLKHFVHIEGLSTVMNSLLSSM